MRGLGPAIAPISNALGATSTAGALVIMVVAKLTKGAWITLLVISAVIVSAEDYPPLLR